MEFYSIGVFQSSEKQFFQKLIDHRIDTFCDIRIRRSVRGSHYAFVNSTRLQERLAALDIRYLHILDLAPTEAIRSIQKAADTKAGVTNTNRENLDPKFIAAYTNGILEHFDWDGFLKQLQDMNAQRVAFFCVEAHAHACHRSLVAERISKATHAPLRHI